MLKISEVFMEQVKEFKERPDGTQYTNFKKVYNTRKCLLNKEYLVSVYPYEFTSSTDLGKIDGVLPAGTKFSTFVMNGSTFRSSEITVVGSFDKFCRLLEDKQG